MGGELLISSQNAQPNIQQPIQTSQPLKNDKSQGNKGLLKVLLVLAILLLLFLTFLNYFNLLPLAYILPKQTVQKETPNSTPSPSEIHVDKIDKESATGILSSLINSSIQPAYQPETLFINPGLSDQDRVSEGSFHGDWQYESATGAALITLSRTRANIDNIRIGFLTPAISQEITEQTAERLYSQYFSIVPKGEWRCQSSKNGIPGIYCENLWETNKIKMFSYIRNPSTNSVATASLVMCQIFPSSFLYSWGSCNPEFANKENVISQ